MSADGVGCSPLPCLGHLFTHGDDGDGDDDTYTIMFMSYIVIFSWTSYFKYSVSKCNMIRLISQKSSNHNRLLLSFYFLKEKSHAVTSLTVSLQAFQIPKK